MAEKRRLAVILEKGQPTFLGITAATDYLDMPRHLLHQRRAG
jgi:hypothetical protein